MIFPLQHFGIGDVIFTQTLVRSFNEPVLWAVDDHFVQGLERAYPDITWAPYSAFSPRLFTIKTLDMTIGGMKILPIRWAEVMQDKPYRECMSAKYELYGMDYRQWRNRGMYVRDMVREQALFDSLGITGPYNLINPTFQTDFRGRSRIYVNNGNQNIEMKVIPGYSIFDWSLVIERAAEVHAVSSAILYLLELLDLKQPLHLYKRLHDRGFQNVEYLFTKPYILHV